MKRHQVEDESKRVSAPESKSRKIEMDMGQGAQRVETSRLSCDEVLMTRSLHEANYDEGVLSDASSSHKSRGGGQMSDTASGTDAMVCQRCFLNTMSNKTLLTTSECDQHRFISQRQYKRKLRRECPSYVTMERKPSKKKTKTKTDAEEDRTLKLISKTTYKLRSTADLTDDTKNLSSSEDPDISLELMEIPLSPTNYDQPPTPPDVDPPSPLEAEIAILQVLDKLKRVCAVFSFDIRWIVMTFTPQESGRNKRSKATETESYYMEPLGKRRIWQAERKHPPTLEERGTTMNIQMTWSKPTSTKSDDSIGSPGSVSGGERMYPKVNGSNGDVLIGGGASLSGDSLSMSSSPDNFLSTDQTSAEGCTKAAATDSGDSGSNLVILSPFDEQEEWQKITKIIDSFGTDIGTAVKSSATPNNCKYII